MDKDAAGSAAVHPGSSRGLRSALVLLEHVYYNLRKVAMNETEKRIRAKNEEDVLGVMNEHPLHSEQIAWRLHISAGEVNAAVLSLRSRGIPICGDDAYGGYYYGCAALMRKTVDMLKWQRKQMDLAIRLFEKRLEEYDDAQKNKEEKDGTC